MCSIDTPFTYILLGGITLGLSHISGVSYGQVDCNWLVTWDKCYLNECNSTVCTFLKWKQSKPHRLVTNQVLFCKRLETFLYSCRRWWPLYWCIDGMRTGRSSFQTPAGASKISSEVSEDTHLTLTQSHNRAEEIWGCVFQNQSKLF